MKCSRTSILACTNQLTCVASASPRIWPVGVTTATPVSSQLVSIPSTRSLPARKLPLECWRVIAYNIHRCCLQQVPEQATLVREARQPLVVRTQRYGIDWRCRKDRNSADCIPAGTSVLWGEQLTVLLVIVPHTYSAR